MSPEMDTERGPRPANTVPKPVFWRAGVLLVETILGQFLGPQKGSQKKSKNRKGSKNDDSLIQPERLNHFGLLFSER